AAQIGAQNAMEPYRRKLSFDWWRLGNDLYASVADFAADLDLIVRSLRAHRGARIADGRLAELRRRVELFGFHLAKLDVRVHVKDLREPDDELRAFFRGVAQAQQRHGTEALDTLVVSGTESADDVARVTALAVEA